MEANLKFVYWFTFYGLESPTVRYRGKYPLDFLKANFGIDSYFIIPGYKWMQIWSFTKAYISALLFPKEDSLVVIQSIYSNFVYANSLKFLIKIRKRNTVFDVDDADYLRYPPGTICFFVKNCETVTVGSAELHKNLSKHNVNTVLIPCPTPDLKIVKITPKGTPLTIGWIGDFTKGHKESLLQSFFPALMDLSFPVKLVLLGVTRKNEFDFLVNYFKGFTHVEVDIPQDINWNDELEVQNRIKDFDIGIATLLDEEFYRSKSAFKTKQCFNNGIPVLSSDIPENNLFVKHGINGYLCNNPEDFKQRIIEFNEMSQERYQEFSNKARNSIPEFNLERFCSEFMHLKAGKR